MTPPPPAGDLPEDVSFLFRPHRDSMNIYFNLSSFLLTQSENVTIDMAELRLYRIARNKERRQQVSELATTDLTPYPETPTYHTPATRHRLVGGGRKLGVGDG